jgi:class 3 adenylate cyclase
MDSQGTRAARAPAGRPSGAKALHDRVTHLRTDVFALIEAAREDQAGDHAAVLAALLSVANQLGAAQRALVEPPGADSRLRPPRTA